LHFFKDMQKLTLTETELQLLKQERYNHPHPRVMLKMDVVYLHGMGVSDSLVREITGVCDNTLRQYLKQYEQGGIERLKAVNFYRPSSELRLYSETIEKYFTEYPPTSISQAASKIEEITGIKRGETQTRKFIKSLHFKYMKTGSVPSKVLTEVKKTSSETFWKKNLPLD